MATVELPSGHTADILDPKEMTAGTKLAVQRSVEMSVQKGGGFIANLAMNEEMKIAALTKLVKSWTHSFTVTAANIENLPIEDYNALSDAIKDHMKLLGSKAPDKSGSEED